jgi:hypothetical protein
MQRFIIQATPRSIHMVLTQVFQVELKYVVLLKYVGNGPCRKTFEGVTFAKFHLNHFRCSLLSLSFKRNARK